MRLVPKEFLTYSFCKEVIGTYGYALQYVPEHIVTDELEDLAIATHGEAIKYVRSQTYERKITALKQDWLAIKAIKNPSSHLMALAQQLREDNDAEYNLKYFSYENHKKVNNEDYCDYRQAHARGTLF